MGGLKTRIAHARYAEGQVGFPHMDFRHGHHGPHFGLPTNDGSDPTHVASRISFTVYLNADYEGGELGFVGKLNDDGTYTGEHSRTRGRTGSAVLFYQGVPEFAHVPHRIGRGSKSIMRADVLYAFASQVDADVGCARLMDG